MTSILSRDFLTSLFDRLVEHTLLRFEDYLGPELRDNLLHYDSWKNLLLPDPQPHVGDYLVHEPGKPSKTIEIIPKVLHGPERMVGHELRDPYVGSLLLSNRH